MRPNWIDPALSSSAAGLSTGSNSHFNGSTNRHVTKCTTSPVETLSLTPNWTFIKAGDQFYAEYNGMSCPLELDSGENGNAFCY